MWGSWWKVIYRKAHDRRVHAGGSEVSDAMSEGERPDEASSLHPDSEDHGMLALKTEMQSAPALHHKLAVSGLFSHAARLRSKPYSTWIACQRLHGACRGLRKAGIKRSNGGHS